MLDRWGTDAMNVGDLPETRRTKARCDAGRVRGHEADVGRGAQAGLGLWVSSRQAYGHPR